MKHNLTIYKDLSRLMTVSLVYLLIFITVLTIYENQVTAPWYLLGIPLILFCNLIIQRYCFQPVFYIILHGIFYIPVLLLPFPNKWYTCLYIVMLVLEDIHAIHIWKHNTDLPYDEAPWYLFFFVAILYIAAIGFRQEHLANCIYFIGLALLLLHFIRFFIHGISNLFYQAEHTTTMPTKKIMLTNSILFGFLSLSFLLLAFFARLFELDRFIYTLGDIIVKLFQIIVKIILYVVAFLRLLFASDTSGQNTSEEKEQLAEAIRELPPESSLFVEILNFIIELAVIAFVIYALYQIISHIIRLFLSRYVTDSDIIISLTAKKETVTAKKANETLISRLKSYLDNSNASKIRRAYRLKIHHFDKAMIEKNDTPTDIANKVFRVYDEDIRELTEVYEKARYSKEEITYEDVKKGGIL